MILSLNSGAHTRALLLAAAATCAQQAANTQHTARTLSVTGPGPQAVTQPSPQQAIYKTVTPLHPNAPCAPCSVMGTSWAPEFSSSSSREPFHNCCGGSKVRHPCTQTQTALFMPRHNPHVSSLQGSSPPCLLCTPLRPLYSTRSAAAHAHRASSPRACTASRHQQRSRNKGISRNC